MATQEEIQAFLDSNTFLCLQSGARITRYACNLQIKKAIEGMGIIGQKNRAIRYAAYHDECFKAMFMCRGCQNGMVNGELKGCRQLYYDNFHSSVRHDTYKDKKNKERNIELDPGNEYSIGFDRDVKARFDDTVTNELGRI